MIRTVNITLKKEESKTLDAHEARVATQDGSSCEEITSSFQSLDVEERSLFEQEAHLKALLNELEIKAREEIERRKQKVDRLSSEVSDLKQRCEKITKWINTSTRADIEAEQADP